MSELTPSDRGQAVGSLVASRAVYAYNWYLIGPIQAAVAAGLGVSFGEVSFFLWAFLVGVGIFQIPAGIASLRWGARRVSLAGIAVMSVGAIVSGLTRSPDVFFAARFVVGVGAALFFSPAIGLIARYYRTGGTGFGIGLFNGAFSMGAGAAVYLTVVLSEVLGWQGALLVAGAGMALVTAENAVVLPALPEPHRPIPEALTQARRVLASRYLWVLALGLTGFWASNFAVAQYLVPWAHTVVGMNRNTAGALDALLILSPLVGGPLGGSLAEHRGNPRRLLFLSALLTGLGIMAFPFLPGLSPLLLWPFAALVGVVSGMVFGVLYYMGTLDPVGKGDNVPLAVGLINSVQVFLGAFLVLGLGYEYFGPQTVGSYTEGWLLFGGLTLIVLPLLWWARTPAPSPIAAPPSSPPSSPT